MNKRVAIQSWITSEILRLKDLIVLCSIRIGKTKCALDAIETGESVLVVYPLIEIKKSWDADVTKFTPKSKNITYSTSHSLKKYKDQYFDYVIIDEPQLYSKAQRDILKTIKYKKRVALTGTLKNSTKSKLKEELKLEVKCEYNLDKAIEDGIVKDYKIYVQMEDLDNIERNTSYIKFGQEIKGTDKEIYDYYNSIMEKFEDSENEEDPKKAYAITMKYRGLLTNHIYNCKTLFNKAIGLTNLYMGNKMLIYSMRTDIASELAFGLSYTSKSRDKKVLEQFKTSKNGALGVVNCIQAGVTIQNLNKVIIHSTESNTEKLQQKIGRSLLYDFEGNYSEIHICCLKDTIMERWVNLGLSSLNQNKIIFVYEGKEYSKLEWIKIKHPNKDLYLYDNGGICFISKIKDGITYYSFIDNPINEYTLKESRLTKL